MPEIRERTFAQDQYDSSIDEMFDSFEQQATTTVAPEPKPVETKPAEPAKEPAEEMSTRDKVLGVTEEVIEAVGGGLEDALQETVQAWAGIGEAINTFAREQGAPEFLVGSEEVAQRAFHGLDPILEQDFIPRSESDAINVVRDISQFMVPFLGGQRALAQRGLGQLAAGATSAFGTSFFALDPAEDNLADFVQKYPALQNPVTEFLASEGENGAEERLKTAVSDLLGGAVIGATGKAIGKTVVDPFISGVKAIKKHRRAVREGFDQADVDNIKAAVTKGNEERTVKEAILEEHQAAVRKSKSEQVLTGELDLAKARKPRKPSKASVAKAFRQKEEFARKAFEDAGKTLDEDKVLKSAGVLDDPNLDAIVKTTSEMTPKQTIAWTQQEAEALGLTLEEAQKKIGTAGEFTAAMRRVVHEQVVDAKELQQAVLQGGIDSLDAQNALAKLMDSGSLVRRAVGEAGRALNATKDTPSIAKALQTIDIQSKQQMEAIIRSSNDPEELMRFTKQLGEARTGDLRLGLKTMWQNSVLSGPLTQVTNIAGTLANLATKPVIRSISARVGPRTADPRVLTVQAGEAVQMWYGMAEGFDDAVRVLARSFDVDEIMKTQGLKTVGKALQKAQGPIKDDPLAKLIRESDFTDEGIGTGEKVIRRAIGASEQKLTLKQFKEMGVSGKGQELLARAVTAPMDFMGATDDFLKMVSARAEKRARVFRAATSQGLQGDELAEFMQRNLNNAPIDETERLLLGNIDKAASEFAKETAFQQDLGKVGNAILDFRENVPGMEFIIPFVKTPVNILDEAFVKSLPVNAFTKRFKDARARGGAEYQQAVAQMYLGTSVLGIGATGFASGKITGAGPSSSKLRKAWLETNQPFSIKVGDEWFDYTKIEPLGTVLGLGARIAELIDASPLDEDGQEKEIMDLVTQAAGGVSKYVTDKSFLTGINLALRTVNGEEGAAEQFASQIAGGFIPFSAALRQTASVVDEELREVDGVLDRIQSGLPGFSDNLPNMRNRWGEKVLRRDRTLGYVLPVAHSSGGAGDDKDVRFINDFETKHGFRIGMPGRVIKGYKLTLEEQDRRLEHLSEFKIGDKTMKQLMVETAKTIEASVGDQQLPGGAIADIMTKTYRDIKNASDASFISQNPDIFDKIKESKLAEESTIQEINPRTGEIETKTKFVGAE